MSASLLTTAQVRALLCPDMSRKGFWNLYQTNASLRGCIVLQRKRSVLWSRQRLIDRGFLVRDEPEAAPVLTHSYRIAL